MASAEERKYHNDKSSAYILPNDAPEHARLDEQAEVLEGIMYGEIFHAPLNPAQVTRCLDIGCGTGVVTNPMARKFPSAEVIGLDLSPVPDIRKWEPNIKFFEGNCVTQQPTEWKAADGKSAMPRDTELFDYVWHRLLMLGISDWSAFFRKEFEILKPGGWAESHDLDGVMFDRENKILFKDLEWYQRLHEGFQMLGLDLKAGSGAADRMKEAGFQDIRQVQYRIPLGGYDQPNAFLRKAGDVWAKDTEQVLKISLKRGLSRASASEDEIARLIKQMGEIWELGDGKYIVFYVTIGRKLE